MSGMENTRLLEAGTLGPGSSGAKSWPVIQPRGPPLNFGFSCCRVLLFLVLALVTFPLLLAAVSLVAGLLTALMTLLGVPLAFALWWLCFYGRPPFDLFWKAMSLQQRILLSGWARPVAKRDFLIDRLAPKRLLVSSWLEYAIGITIPVAAEEEFAQNTQAERESSRNSSIPVSFLPEDTNLTRFAPDENPVQYLMDALGDIYPTIHTNWDDKTSDDAFSRMALYGLGAHRIEPADETLHPGCKFLVATNQLAYIPVKEGLEHYGGDAYFDANWRPVKIVIPEQTQPWEPRKINTHYPDGSKQWELAKFRWRSSLFALITVVDHLYGIHLQVGNVIVTAAREQLSASHPVRRFLVPFMYRTITINDAARQLLVTRQSIVPRTFAFNVEGLQLAWAACPDLLPGGAELRDILDPKEFLEAIFNRETYIDYRERVLGTSTTYYTQARQYWRIIKKFVTSYVELYYPTAEALSKDDELRLFVLQAVNVLQATASLIPPGNVGPRDETTAWSMLTAQEKKDVVINLISRFCDLVTTGHEQVGNIQVYAQDVSWCAWSWPKGEMCGAKENAIAQGMLMSLTSTPMPRLLVEPGSDDDWSFLWPVKEESERPKMQAIFRTFQAELKAMSEEIDRWNATVGERSFPLNFPFNTFNPKFLETSVSI